MKCCAFILAFTIGAHAATYYVDATLGKDANAGIAKTSAWQHCPGMRSFTGRYTKNATGDRFIFKGGERWATTNFCFRIQSGSSSAQTPMYYGVDRTWFSGSAWTRPFFDAQSCVISNNAGIAQYSYNAAMILIQSTNTTQQCSNIEIDSLEIANLRGRVATNQSDGICCIALRSAARTSERMTNIFIHDCSFHDWTLPRYNGGDDSGDWGGIKVPYGNAVPCDLTIQNCEFYQTDPSQQCGVALRSLQGTRTRIIGNSFHDLGAAIALCAGDYFSNRFWNIGINGGFADPLAHENVLYNSGISRVAWNWTSNNIPPSYYDESGCWRTANSALFNTNDGTGITAVWDNVWLQTRTDANPAVEIDPENLSGGTAVGIQRTGLRFNNNTIYSAANYCVRMTTGRPASNDLGYLEFTANHFITNRLPALSVSQSTVVQPIVYSQNVTNSLAQAVSFGMTLANGFQPISTNQPLFAAGLDLRAPPYNTTNDFFGHLRSGIPDVGAYEYQEPPVITPTNSPPRMVDIEIEIPGLEIEYSITNNVIHLRLLRNP